VGVARLRDAYVYREHQVLVFDRLAYDLYELLKHEKFCGISLKLVRKFAVQITETLEHLSQYSKNGLGLIHCDLKPENIMVEVGNKAKVKVIDFGSSCFAGEQGSTYIQSRFYRAPEILIGCPYTTQIDMWSFGCVLFEMYTGRPLFNGKNAEDQLLKIVQLLGAPPVEMLARRKNFLANTKEGTRLGLEDKTSRNFTDRFRALGYAAITRRKRADGVALADDVKTAEDGRVTDENLLQFLDFVTKCLDVDPEKRMKPHEGMRHPFVSQRQKSQSNKRPADEARTGEVDSANSANAGGAMQVDAEKDDTNMQVDTPQP